MGDRNKTAYTSSGIVKHYASLNYLQPAEAAILKRLQAQLPTMTMLDIGVGAGRTTQYFAPLVKQYVGVDYSPEMIAACQRRFKDAQDAQHSMRFDVVDARNLSQFEDSSFDFILFSYNGIDYVSHEDRLKILAEVKRMGKPGGYFLFSSHNLQVLERNLTWKKQFSLNPIRIGANLIILGLFWRLNPSLDRQTVANSDYLVVRDDSHQYRLDTYYIRAAQQLNQLSKDFSQVEIHAWKDGEESLSLDSPAMETALWLYYLCRINPTKGISA
ncbi:MAG: class I SAM-dependent methyltransferase [Cyanobacteria bacterium P01_F01_bin.13]